MLKVQRRRRFSKITKNCRGRLRSEILKAGGDEIYKSQENGKEEKKDEEKRQREKPRKRRDVLFVSQCSNLYSTVTKKRRRALRAYSDKLLQVRGLSLKNKSKKAHMSS